jgi:hypothetical protein
VLLEAVALRRRSVDHIRTSVASQQEQRSSLWFDLTEVRTAVKLKFAATDSLNSFLAGYSVNVPAGRRSIL